MILSAELTCRHHLWRCSGTLRLLQAHVYQTKQNCVFVRGGVTAFVEQLEDLLGEPNSGTLISVDHRVSQSLRLRWNDPSDTATRIGNVPTIPGNHVQMRVSDRLAGSLADIDANVVAVRVR